MSPQSSALGSAEAGAAGDNASSIPAMAAKNSLPTSMSPLLFKGAKREKTAFTVFSRETP
jgi:hypothetical protein